MTALPLYLAGPALIEVGGVEGLTWPADTPDAIPVQDLSTFPGADDAPGWILISDEIDASEVIELLVRLARRTGEWSPLLVREGPVLIPLSPGWSQTSAEVGDRLAHGGSPARFLSYRQAMADLARVRHDINNPLTAALAEVQLGLLDTEPGTELAAGLEVIEAQIRRIRDMVAELTGYRTPRP